jgi:uncharacterized protein YndB with AHSA1/START domain
MKTSTFRGRQTVTIQAPRAQVWEYVTDLAKIAEYNPRVARVEPGSGDGRRAAGVSYQGHVVGGGRCTEEDVEIVPMERVVTRMAHDTLGISARLKDYTVETTLTELDACTTKVTMSHSYATPTLRSLILMRIKNWDYRELRERINDGHTLRTFTDFDSHRLPKHDAFNRAFNRLTPATMQAINQAVVQTAV